VKLTAGKSRTSGLQPDHLAERAKQWFRGRLGEGAQWDFKRGVSVQAVFDESGIRIACLGVKIWHSIQSPVSKR